MSARACRIYTSSGGHVVDVREVSLDPDSAKDRKSAGEGIARALRISTGGWARLSFDVRDREGRLKLVSFRL
jgi:hypothetical protein